MNTRYTQIQIGKNEIYKMQYFSALHGMTARTSDQKGPSVSLSNA